jgi:hypothetical protein
MNNVTIAKIAFLFAIMAFSFHTKALADTEPDLATTFKYLIDSLPSEETFSSDFITTISDHIEYSSDDCILTIHKAEWIKWNFHSTPNPEPEASESILDEVSKIRFMPRTGDLFLYRTMNDSETQEFKTKYPGDGHFVGSVSVIDFSKIRLDNIGIAATEKLYGGSWVAGSSKDGRAAWLTVPIDVMEPKESYVEGLYPTPVWKVVSALRHAAMLCGATNDPF